jgi:hypothetical protein
MALHPLSRYRGPCWPLRLPRDYCRFPLQRGKPMLALCFDGSGPQWGLARAPVDVEREDCSASCCPDTARANVTIISNLMDADIFSSSVGCYVHGTDNPISGFRGAR